MLIPYQQLSEDTLRNIIESFVLREGTDYGELEYSFEEKVTQVLQQLMSGEVLIEYSEEHESVTLIKAP